MRKKYLLRVMTFNDGRDEKTVFGH
jgi:hypothetical protein